MNKFLRLLIDTALFDEAYYCDTIGLEFDRTGAARHFLKHGISSGVSPCKYFDTKYYLETNKDVRALDMNAFIHYLLHGQEERRAPHPGFKLAKFLSDHRDLLVHKTNILECFVEYIDQGLIKEADYFSQSDDTESLFKQKEAITRSGLFDPGYYLASYPDIEGSGTDPLDHYLHFGGFEDRNPSLDFDSRYYLDNNEDARTSGLNPLFHYLRSGISENKKAQPEASVAFKEYTTTSPERPLQIAFQVHLFYPEVIHEILPLLTRLEHRFGLYISVSSQSDKRYVSSVVLDSECRHDNFSIRIVPNVGRDLAPLIVTFKDMWQHYDYICHLHSKKSPHTNIGERWRMYLFDQLIGSDRLVQTVLSYLDQNRDVGCLYPDNFYEVKKYISWGGNKARVQDILKKAGIEDVDLKTQEVFEFPASSMCWMKTDVFIPLINAGFTHADFESEDGSVEGTMAHALERCLAILPLKSGYRTVKYYARIQQPEAFKGRYFQPCTLHEGAGMRWEREKADIAINRPQALLEQFTKFNPASLNIHWVIPDFIVGAGGHMTIFRMVYFLERFGHRQAIWIQNSAEHNNGEHARRTIQQHYQPISDAIPARFLPDDVDFISGDVVIATDCWTVYPVVSMRRFKARFYFIQDWEPMFHAMGENWLIAQETYRMGLNALCAGKWLYQKAVGEGMWARQWDLSSDPAYYFPPDQTGGRPADRIDVQNTIRIAFYARTYTPRRAVRLGVAALRELHRRGIAFHVDFFGEEGLDFRVPFSHSYKGILTAEALGDLYRSAGIGMVFSTTNYSLVPLEMMACGLPVLEMDTESTRAVYPDDSVCFAKPNPHDIADQLFKLIQDKAYREALGNAGMQFVSQFSWEDSARKVEQALIEKIIEKGNSPLDLNTLFAKPNNLKYRASVIIPTYNGGELFNKVMARVTSQKCPWPYEVLIIDSGSTDGTVQYASQYLNEHVRLLEIPNKAFQHGRTRNLGIEHTSGDFIAFLTQDAMPANEHWLKNLVGGFDKSEKVAGVIGRHKAYPQHSEYVRREMNKMFARFNRCSEIYSWDGDLPSHIRKGSIDWQMLVLFYSDNNSCMRRSVWQQVPYPEIDWGEDQVWSWNIIKLGLEKAYVHDAVVYHSHAFSYEKQYDVSRIESRFWHRHFGIRLQGMDVDLNALIVERKKQMSAFARDHHLSQEEGDELCRMVEAIENGRFAGLKDNA